MASKSLEFSFGRGGHGRSPRFNSFLQDNSQANII